ncbi:MAG TPA: bis(5'-nucleosyl)-tetraphosphatase (symmetrical) YqeK [Rubrobacteraceae bacterium]|nr:bis(5'-nucleosyl)-tetraphosphatase (symmetrical) YqeK [Rubrobacteraceae bacterium]
MEDREPNYVSSETADAFARDRLSEKRYAHTIRVTETAERLARTHALNEEWTRLAALLHDAAREMSAGEYLRLARDWDLPVGDFERENPKLLHGPVAAELARRKLGVEDEEVLEAIRVHTTGVPGMSYLALAVYVADKIEPARDYPSVGHLRDLAAKDLRAAAREALRRAISYNEQRGRDVHPESRKTLEWLEETEETS